jgi:hypothetical protein
VKRVIFALVILAATMAAGGCSAGVQADGVFLFGKNVQPDERSAVKAGVKAMQDWAYINGQIRLRRFTVLVDDNLNTLVSEYERETRDPDPLSAAQWFVSGGAITSGRTIYIYVGPEWKGASDAAKSFVAAHETFHVIQFGFGYDDWRTGLQSEDLPPPWYLEGGADYAAARALDAAGIEAFDDYQSDARDQSLSYARPLASITRGPADRAAGDAAAYAVGFLAVTELAASHGETAMFDLWDHLAEEGSWRASFASTYGSSPDEFVAGFDSRRSSTAGFVTGGVSGTLKRDSGEPIPGAGIVACSLEGAAGKCRVTWTGEDGAFDLALPSGEWRVAYQVATRTGTERGVLVVPGSSDETVSVANDHIGGLDATIHKPF